MRYNEIKKHVEALSSDRSVTLVCVSKYHTVDEISAVYQMGQREFGENKVQDLLLKMEQLPADINWHLLGHLQTNKVKQIVGRVSLIHSLDSLHLAEEIQKHAQKLGVICRCLIQVNSTELPDRYGVPYDCLSDFIESVSAFPNIEICGLMGMAPKGENPTPYFQKLQNAFQSSPLKDGILSMGMSEDYPEAIACGSTMVRIGRCIFE